MDNYDFVRDADSPDSANPSLWRNTKSNANYGLFQVSDDIYQVRGYDLSNMTFVRTDNGWIIMDCLASSDTAKAALELFKSEMGDIHIVAVIISHAHIDHYGGIQESSHRTNWQILLFLWMSRLHLEKQQSSFLTDSKMQLCQKMYL